MKRLLLYIIILNIIFCCSSHNENSYRTEQINNSTFQYKLENGKLTDTLKVFDSNDKLVYIQVWKSGKLVQTSYIDEAGKIRILEFHELIDSNSTRQYYLDKNDEDFKLFPFTNDMFEFYEKHCFLSQYSIQKDSVNRIDLFNYPKKHARIAVTHGMIMFENGEFTIKPHQKCVDSMKVLLNNPMTGKFTKKFNLIVY